MASHRMAAESRRSFLKFLAASPVLALGSGVAKALDTWDTTPGNQPLIRRWLEPMAESGTVISSPGDAISIYDFERTARHELSAAHYGYLATGVDGNAALIANRETFERVQIRPRRLVDVRTVDTSVEILGETWRTPVSLAPVGQLNTFHETGERGMAAAIRETGHQAILSTVATTTVEDVAEAAGRPIWFQLYPMWSWEVTRGFIARAENAAARYA